jgi:glyoxylase-like metal-dependent hydrolase (beta-lactamase superfamily II)
MADPLAVHDVALVRAGNPSRFTLSGTNTWLVGRDPCWVVDPGPALPGHVREVAAQVAARGGLGGIAVTHDHADHAEAVGALLEAAGASGAAPVVAARLPGTAPRAEAMPFVPVPTPGHAPDHLAFRTPGGVLFTGDAVLGEGSVFVWPDPGALAGYLAALEGLLADPPELICPGHGPVVTRPAAKLREYLEHRRAREAALVAALDAGARTVDALLDAAWGDVPAVLRPAAAVTLAAHMDKLAGEGRLPADAVRPSLGVLTAP